MLLAPSDQTRWGFPALVKGDHVADRLRQSHIIDRAEFLAVDLDRGWQRRKQLQRHQHVLNGLVNDRGGQCWVSRVAEARGTSAGLAYRLPHDVDGALDEIAHGGDDGAVAPPVRSNWGLLQRAVRLRKAC